MLRVLFIRSRNPQTIIQSYGEFLAAAGGGGGGNKSIMSSLPPLPPLAAAESILGTRDLSDDNDYLFAPTSSGGSGSGATPPV